MANFCPQCGAPAGGAFCSKCGQPMGSAPQQAPAAPAPPPQQAAVVAAPAVAKSSNTLLKVILVVLGLFFVMGVVGMMGVWYVATKVRDKAREYGFNDSVPAMRRGAARSMGESRDGCKLLSANEAASMLGKTIARTVTATSGEGCSYFASEADAEKIGQETAERVKQAMKEGDASNSPDAAQKFSDEILRALASAGQAAESHSGVALLGFTVNRDGGGSAMASTRIVQGWSKQFPGSGGFKEVPGLGDRALITPVAGLLMVQKGDSMIMVTVGPVADAREKSIAIARKLLDRM